MSCPHAFYQWNATIGERFPHLTKPQAKVLALWSWGMVLARSCALNAVSYFLAEALEQRYLSVRSRLQEWYCPAAAKKGTQGQGQKRCDWEVDSCFAPLLGWVLSLWQGRQLALALDATPLGERFVVLCVSVLYRLSGLRDSRGLEGVSGPREDAVAQRVAAAVAPTAACGARRLLRDCAGRSGFVCALAVSAYCAVRLAPVFAGQQEGHLLSAGRSARQDD